MYPLSQHYLYVLAQEQKQVQLFAVTAITITNRHNAGMTLSRSVPTSEGRVSTSSAVSAVTVLVFRKSGFNNPSTRSQKEGLIFLGVWCFPCLCSSVGTSGNRTVVDSRNAFLLFEIKFVVSRQRYRDIQTTAGNMQEGDASNCVPCSAPGTWIDLSMFSVSMYRVSINQRYTGTCLNICLMI